MSHREEDTDGKIGMNELVKFWAVIASLSLALYGAGAANFQLGTVDEEIMRNREADANQWRDIGSLKKQVAALEEWKRLAPTLYQSKSCNK